MKIDNSTKTDIEVSFKKKKNALTLRISFKKYTVWKECKALVFCLF